MEFEPRDEHRWLHRLVGDWTFEGEAVMGPDQPPERMTGTERVRKLGEAWVVCEMTHGGGEAPSSIMTLGFDPARGRFVGTFVADGMTHLWTYAGTLDADRRVLTLDTEGPSFAGEPGLVPYQDSLEIASDDERILRSAARRPDGTWRAFMTSRYRRTG